MELSNSRKKIIGGVAVAMALAVGTVASFALFTDTATVSGTATAGKLAIGVTAEGMEDGDFSAQLLNEDFGGIDNLNPGDSRDISYTIENEQNKAMYANDTITLKVTPADGHDISADDCKIALEGAGEGKAVDNPDGSVSITYTGSETVLSGTGKNAEVVSDHTATTADRAYTLSFDKDAGNEYQGATVTIESKIDAVQYANNDGLDGATIVAETDVTDANGAVIGG